MEELAALASGARVAADALADQSGKQARDLDRVLESFDRAVERLSASPPTHGEGVDVVADTSQGSSEDVAREERTSSHS